MQAEVHETYTELEAVRAALASAQRMLLTAEDEGLRIRAEVERLRALARGSETNSPRGACAVDVANRAPLVAVVDTDPTWAEAAAADRRVAVLHPAADLAAQLAEVGPRRVLVNLATTGALDALVGLRGSGWVDPPSACLSAPGALEVFPLGIVETIAADLDPDAVVAKLAPYRGRWRILAAGTDGERLMGLRQRLTRIGMSVSIGWDTKQVAALLEMLVPEVAIVDLGLPPGGGYSIVARLAAIEPPPVTFLVPARNEAGAGFRATLADVAVRRRMVPRDRLLDEVLRRRAVSVDSTSVRLK